MSEDHPRKFTADAALNAAVQAGEKVLSAEHLAEIELRRGVADIDILIGACKKYLDLLENYGWSPSDEAPIDEPGEPDLDALAEKSDASGKEA